VFFFLPPRNFTHRRCHAALLQSPGWPHSPPAPSSSSAAVLATRAVRPSRSGARGLASGDRARPPSPSPAPSNSPWEIGRGAYLHRRTSSMPPCPVPLCRTAAIRPSHRHCRKQGAQVYAEPFVSDEHPIGMPTLLFPSCCAKPSTQTLESFVFRSDLITSIYMYPFQR
jgi:hypothetical protein